MAAINGQWIGVDLDGTLARFDGWRGIDHIGEPIMPMVERVRKWLEEGKNVRIMTARAFYLPNDEASIREAIQAVSVVQLWCLNVFGRVLPVRSQKDYSMLELWDDRAIQVEFNTGRRMGG